MQGLSKDKQLKNRYDEVERLDSLFLSLIVQKMQNIWTIRIQNL